MKTDVARGYSGFSRGSLTLSPTGISGKARCVVGHPYDSDEFKKFVDDNQNVGDEFIGPNGEVVTKKYQTTPSTDPRKHVVLNEQSTRGSVDVILREQDGGNDGHEVVYKKYANHSVPSHNAYPVKDRLDDNLNELRQGTKADEVIAKQVLRKHKQWHQRTRPLTR